MFLCRLVATPRPFASTFLGPVDVCRSARRVFCFLPLAPPPLNYLCTIRARALLLLVELILISSSAATHAHHSDRVRCVSLPLPLCLFASTLAHSLVMLFPPSSHSAGCAVICCAVFLLVFRCICAQTPSPDLRQEESSALPTVGLFSIVLPVAKVPQQFRFMSTHARARPSSHAAVSIVSVVLLPVTGAVGRRVALVTVSRASPPRHSSSLRLKLPRFLSSPTTRGNGLVVVTSRPFPGHRSSRIPSALLSP